MSLEDERAQREVSREMSKRIREAAGITGATQRDTAGNTVRDEQGRYVKSGQGLDGGSRGGDAPREKRGNDLINHRLRARVGIDDGLENANV